MAGTDWTPLTDPVDKLMGAVSNPALRKLMDTVGVEAKKAAERAEVATIGPQRGFSHWRMKSGDPIPLDTRYEHVGEGQILFHPTKRAAGPWTVAEFGRNTAEGPRMVGPRLTKTGKISKAKQRRFNGRTSGKGTATLALGNIERLVPHVVEREIGNKMRRFFS